APYHVFPLPSPSGLGRFFLTRGMGVPKPTPARLPLVCKQALDGERIVLVAVLRGDKPLITPNAPGTGLLPIPKDHRAFSAALVFCRGGRQARKPASSRCNRYPPRPGLLRHCERNHPAGRCGGSAIPCPCVHQLSALLEQVTAPICSLDFVG